MLGECEVFDRVGGCKRLLGEMRYVESCKELVSRMARYSIELGVVRRMLGEMIRYLIELRVVRSLLEGF